VFRLGDEVRVAIKNTDLVKKQIDFMLYETGSGSESNASKGKRREPQRGGKQKRGKGYR
jgi:hypothetical protein